MNKPVRAIWSRVSVITLLDIKLHFFFCCLHCYVVSGFDSESASIATAKAATSPSTFHGPPAAASTRPALANARSIAAESEVDNSPRRDQHE